MCILIKCVDSYEGKYWGKSELLGNVWKYHTITLSRATDTSQTMWSLLHRGIYCNESPHYISSGYLFGMKTFKRWASFHSLIRHHGRIYWVQYDANILSRWKVNNGCGHRRREAARCISQSDSVYATMGNRDPWVVNILLNAIRFLILYLSSESAPFPSRKGSTNVSIRCLLSGLRPLSTLCRSALALVDLCSFL